WGSQFPFQTAQELDTQQKCRHSYTDRDGLAISMFCPVAELVKGVQKHIRILRDASRPRIEVHPTARQPLQQCQLPEAVAWDAPVVGAHRRLDHSVSVPWWL